MTSCVKIGDRIEEARSYFSFLICQGVYSILTHVYSRCVFILCSSCSSQSLTISCYLSFGPSRSPSFPRGRTLAPKICFIDLSFVSCGPVIDRWNSGRYYKTEYNSSPHNSDRGLVATSSRFLVCQSLICISSVIAAEQHVEQI